MLQNVSRLSEGYAFRQPYFHIPAAVFLFDGIQWNYTRIIGKRGDKFYLIAPAGGYTGEQALVTMERLYNKLHQ